MFSRRQTMGQFVDYHTMCDTLNKPVGSFAHAQKIGTCSLYMHTIFHGRQQLTCYYQIAISGHVTTESYTIGPFTTVPGNPPLFCG